MKIEVRKDESVETGGFQVSAMSFDMSKTAKLFHMLSSTLYSNKISSIIRELSSNAYDSHKMAGKLDVPFDLTSPTFENPIFVIQDYGVGLTAEQAEKTILCYLGSDKDDSEEFIGGWGIGAKSPFAYATTYEVIVIKNGIKTTFACWKNENGIPDKAMTSQIETEESNGVTMKVPVDAKDIHDFCREIKEYQKWTNYNILVDGVSKQREVFAEKIYDDYRVVVYRGTGQRRLVYGGFGYNMSECIEDKYSYSSNWVQLERRLSSVYDIAFIIDTPNLVSFNMNREVLEQTDKSKAFINKVVGDFVDVAKTKEKLLSQFNTDMLTKNKIGSLVEFDNKVQECLTKIDPEDDKFVSIFSYSNKISYRFVSQGFKVIQYRGIYNISSIDIPFAESKDSFCVAWSPRLPSAWERRSAVSNLTEDKKIVLYVKAKTEEDAKKWISEKEDFVGYDVDSIEFVKIQITPRAKATREKVDRPKLKYVVDSVTKKRKSIQPNTIYIYYTDEESRKPLTDRENFYINNKVQKFFFFTPKSEKLIEEYEDLENVISYEEFSEVVDEYIEQLNERCIPEKLHNRLYDTLDSLNSLINMNGVEIVTPNRNELNSIQDKCVVSSSYRGTVVKPNLTYSRKVVKSIREARKLVNKIEPWTKLINFRTVKSSNTDEAKELMEFLESKKINLKG